MKTVTTREAQHHLSKVLEMVSAGEEVIITRRGKQVALVTPIDDNKSSEPDVDWELWAEEQKAFIAKMPHVGENPILAEREEYKW
ncbi:MAG: type II toxin-antitoxin system Phd/YefM family antitoxin [Akkermansiaceae bacterium]